MQQIFSLDIFNKLSLTNETDSYRQYPHHLFCEKIF